MTQADFNAINAATQKEKNVLGPTKAKDSDKNSSLMSRVLRSRIITGKIKISTILAKLHIC